MAGEHDSEQWQHDLRNAVNVALLAVTVAERLLQQGDAAHAVQFLVDTREACERAQGLLAMRPRGGAPPG